MKPNYLNKLVIVLTVVAILGFVTNAFAQRGAGCFSEGFAKQGSGQNKSSMNNFCMDKLSEEQFKAMNEQRKAFFNATEDLRQGLYEKEAELMSVLAQKKPDAEKAKAIQKEISALEATMNQKRLDHIIKMKKINPYCGRKACGMRFRDKKGFGFHSKDRKGSGSRFKGGCW